VVRAEVRHAEEERARAQVEDLVGPVGHIVGGLEERAERVAACLDSMHGPDPDGGPMVEQLHGGCHRRNDTIDVEWSHVRRDRARGRRGTGVRGTFGEKPGVTLVQPDDGVAQPGGGEGLVPPAAPCVSTSMTSILSVS
jgi:hypothetical protein